jgi:hypothetical protein
MFDYLYAAFFDCAKKANYFDYYPCVLLASPIVILFVVEIHLLYLSDSVRTVLVSMAGVLRFFHPPATVLFFFASFTVLKFVPIHDIVATDRSGNVNVLLSEFDIIAAQMLVLLCLGLYFNLVVKSKYLSSRPWNFLFAFPVDLQRESVPIESIQQDLMCFQAPSTRPPPRPWFRLRPSAGNMTRAPSSLSIALSGDASGRGLRSSR